MAETEVRLINGRTIVDTKARKAIEDLQNGGSVGSGYTLTDADKNEIAQNVKSALPFLDMVATFDDGSQEAYEIYGKMV